jgi:hypothetical protein
MNWQDKMGMLVGLLLYTPIITRAIHTLHPRLDNVERVDDQSRNRASGKTGDRLDEGGRQTRTWFRVYHRGLTISLKRECMLQIRI